MGIHANAQGQRLSDSGLDDDAVRTAFAARAPVTEELEWGDTSILLQVIPLLEEGTPNGALLLMRDVSELRRRDRLLLSKDATIREIHHRVKNNLQTIASLLRLQGRRLSSPEAKQALEESVRRIRSIALVHETLAYEAGNTVPFGEIIRPLVRVVEDGLTSPDRHIRFTVEGDPGDLPAEVATPLAVVLTELLQNAVEHGFPDNGSAAHPGGYGDRAGGPGGRRRGGRRGRQRRRAPARLLAGDGFRARPVDRADAGAERAGRRADDEERRRHHGAPPGAHRRPRVER